MDNGAYSMCWTRPGRRSSARCASSTCAKATGSCSCTRSRTSRATRTYAISTRRYSGLKTGRRTRCWWRPTRWTSCTSAPSARRPAATSRAHSARRTSRPAPRSRRSTSTPPSTSWCASSGTTRSKKRSRGAGGGSGSVVFSEFTLPRSPLAPDRCGVASTAVNTRVGSHRGKCLCKYLFQICCIVCNPSYFLVSRHKIIGVVRSPEYIVECIC